MKFTIPVQLPPVPRVEDAALQRYLHDLHRAVQTALQAVHEDIKQGASELTNYEAAPTTAQVEQGRLALRVDAGNEAIYANVSGTMKSVLLS